MNKTDDELIQALLYYQQRWAQEENRAGGWDLKEVNHWRQEYKDTRKALSKRSGLSAGDIDDIIYERAYGGTKP